MKIWWYYTNSYHLKFFNSDYDSLSCESEPSICKSYAFLIPCLNFVEIRVGEKACENMCCGV